MFWLFGNSAHLLLWAFHSCSAIRVRDRLRLSDHKSASESSQHILVWKLAWWEHHQFTNSKNLCSSLWTSSIGIIWELVRKAGLWGLTPDLLNQDLRFKIVGDLCARSRLRCTGYTPSSDPLAGCLFSWCWGVGVNHNKSNLLKWEEFGIAVGSHVTFLCLSFLY